MNSTDRHEENNENDCDPIVELHPLEGIENDIIQNVSETSTYL